METSEVVNYFLIIRAWPDESHSSHLCHILDTKYPIRGLVLNLIFIVLDIDRMFDMPFDQKF